MSIKGVQYRYWTPFSCLIEMAVPAKKDLGGHCHAKTSKQMVMGGNQPATYTARSAYP